MLHQLFSSNTRVKLLKLFLFNPEKKFFVRELTRLLDEHLNSIRRELSNLEEVGLIKCVEGDDVDTSSVVDDDLLSIKSSGKIQKKYYQTNQEFDYFSELKALFLKSEIISENEIKEKIKTIEGVGYFILTGYFTNTDSPTDILAVGTFNNEELLVLVSELEKMVGRELNYTVMNREEFVHRLNLIDKFLYKILECKKIVVKDEISEGLNKYMSENILKDTSNNK